MSSARFTVPVSTIPLLPMAIGLTDAVGVTRWVGDLRRGGGCSVAGKSGDADPDGGGKSKESNAH